MSDARVTFGKLNDLRAEAGLEQTFSFNCPRRPGGRCEGLILKGRTNLPHDPQGKNGGCAQWGWSNPSDRGAPTFAPSIDCGTCGWHGYIERGRCVSVAKKDEPEPAHR